MYVYSEVSPILLNGVYSQVCLRRTVAFILSVPTYSTRGTTTSWELKQRKIFPVVQAEFKQMHFSDCTCHMYTEEHPKQHCLVEAIPLDLNYNYE